MTVKEMFRKVAKFNKSAEELGLGYKKVIKFHDEMSFFRARCSTYKEFTDMVKDTFVDAFANELMTRDDFNLNGETTFKTVDWAGTYWESTNINTVSFTVVDADL